MKLAIIGSRTLDIDIKPHIPAGVTMIISGGAKGIDREAARYARENGIELIEVLPDYRRYGRGAPLRRNDEIVERADSLLVFWDGKSRGTRYVIEQARKKGKPCKVIYA